MVMDREAAAAAAPSPLFAQPSSPAAILEDSSTEYAKEEKLWATAAGKCNLHPELQGAEARCECTRKR
eukprot:COSAG04_NODE_21237_length_377_cov_1.208633_1_plen_67_part_01